MKNYTLTNLYGFSILTDVDTGASVLAVPLPLPQGIYFHIVHRFDDYQTASLAALAMHQGGMTPEDFIGEDDDETETTADPVVRGAVGAAQAQG